MFTQFRKIIRLIFIPLIIFAIIYFESCSGSFTYTTLKNDCNTGRVIDSSANLVDTLYSGTGNDLFCVNMVDPSTGYISGEKGTILKTNNGGMTWNTLISGTGVDLMGISALNNDTVIAVGHSNTIIRTTDKGLSWNNISNPGGRDLNSVSFADNDTGFACGVSGLIIKTYNSGRTWDTCNSGSGYDLYCINFITRDTGIAVGQNGIILKTVDAGSSWTAIDTTNSDLWGVDFLDFRVMAVGSGGVILVSTDYGNSWVTMVSGTPKRLKSVAWNMQNIAYAVGADGIDLFYNGTAWSLLPQASPDTLNFVCNVPIKNFLFQIQTYSLFKTNLPLSPKVGNLGCILQNQPPICNTASMVINHQDSCSWCIQLTRDPGSYCMSFNNMLVVSSTNFGYENNYNCVLRMNVWDPAQYEQPNYVFFTIHSLSSQNFEMRLQSYNSPFNLKFYLANIQYDAFDPSKFTITDACYIQQDSIICCEIPADPGE